jgi:hypothetical protein
MYSPSCLHIGRISRSMSRWRTEYGAWKMTNLYAERMRTVDSGMDVGTDGVFPFVFAY